MTLPEYLKIHEGSRWNYENSAYVLAHVEQIERTYRAMLDEALAKVEAAATGEPSAEACKHPRGALDNSHFHMNCAQGEIVVALEKHGLSPCDAIKASSDAMSIAWTTWNDMAKLIEEQAAMLAPMEEHHA